MNSSLNYVGDTYILWCGNKVKVNTHDTETGNVTVEDKFGNVRKTLLKRVLAGRVEWPATEDSVSIYCDEYEAFSVSPLPPQKTDDIYYVYFVYHKNEIVYIGKGNGNRYKHVTSGKSHVSGLNNLHFAGEDLKVEFYLEDADENVALNVETDCIKKFKPKFNTAKNKQLEYSSSISNFKS